VARDAKIRSRVVSNLFAVAVDATEFVSITSSNEWVPSFETAGLQVNYKFPAAAVFSKLLGSATSIASK
jgi:hypothetical protein